MTSVATRAVTGKILFALIGCALCAAALAADPAAKPAAKPVRGPVVVDVYPAAKGAKAPQFTMDADARRLDSRQLGQALAGVAKDKARGANMPVAVLLDPSLTLADVGNVANVVNQSGMKQARYFVYDGGRTMVREMTPRAGQAFPRTRLESEVMAAPQ